MFVYLRMLVLQFCVVTVHRSLDIARGRVKRLNLSNVKFILGNIQNFNESFDVGLSLHACGVATDIAWKLGQSTYLSRVVSVRLRIMRAIAMKGAVEILHTPGVKSIHQWDVRCLNI